MNYQPEFSPETPLENHLVLENIFSFLNVSSLRNVRLVNKFWYEVSSSILYEKSCVHLPLNKLVKFNELSMAPKCFQNFALYSFEIESTELDQNIKTFIGNYCMLAKELALSKSIFENSTAFLEVIGKFQNIHTIVLGSLMNKNTTEQCNLSLFTPNQNVKTLELTFGSDESMLIPWNQLFQMFPSIEDLSAQCRTSQNISELLTALLLNGGIHLSSFSSFLTSYNHENLKSLASLNYKFKKLDLNVSGAVSSSSPLKDVFKKCCTTLTELKLYHDISPDVPVNFDFNWRLINLKELELVGDMIKSINFIDNLPNLEKLNILQDHDNDEPQFLSVLENNAFENVNIHKNLHCLFLEYRVSESAVQNLCRKMPKLKELSAYLEDESIQFVFKYMNNLQVLNIFGSEISDEGITGVPIHILLNNSIRFKKAYRDSNYYIGDMKGLIKFCLKSELQENISDFAISYGFLDVPSLNYIELPGTAISDQGIQKLREATNIQFISADYFAEDGMLYKRKKE